MVRQRLRACEGHFWEGPTFRARAAKPGEQLRSSVDPTKAEDLLGWLRRGGIGRRAKRNVAVLQNYTRPSMLGACRKSLFILDFGVFSVVYGILVNL
jgi:hypothetical protein